MIEVTRITAEELRDMKGKEGLVLQGCAESFQEWVDGVSDMLTEENILKDGSRFEKALAFEHDGLTNLLFLFEGVKLDMGRLAMWRLKTHDVFGGTWLSDYIPNQLGGLRSRETPQKERPKMQLEGMDGNIFAVLGSASKLLKRAGQGAEVKEMADRVYASGSYEEALSIISEYVETELSPVADLHAAQRKKKAKSTQER